MVATITILALASAGILALTMLAEWLPSVGDYPTHCTPYDGLAQQWARSRPSRQEREQQEKPPAPVLGVEYLAAVHGTSTEAELEYMQGVKTPLDGVPDSARQVARQITDRYHQGSPTGSPRQPDRQPDPLSDKADSTQTDSPTDSHPHIWQLGPDGQRLMPVAPAQEAASQALSKVFKSRFQKIK